MKSAYKLIFNRKFENAGADQPSTSGDALWKRLWKLQVPPKVEVFWWGVFHEFLSARHILWRRHIEPVVFCETCGASEETISHVLLDCTVAKDFWRHTRMATGVKIPSLHSVSWASDLLMDICSDRARSVILCGMWALWMMRNNRRHGEQGMTVQQAVMWARDTAFDLWQLSQKADDKVPTRSTLRWAPPEIGWVKINTDAAFSMEAKNRCYCLCA